MKTKFFVLIVMCMILTSCNKDENQSRTVILNVDSKIHKTELLPPGQPDGTFADCLIAIEEGTNKEYKFYQTEIKGFEFEEGYEYRLKVFIEPMKIIPADVAHFETFTLIEILSKKKVN